MNVNERAAFERIANPEPSFATLATVVRCLARERLKATEINVEEGLPPKTLNEVIRKMAAIMISPKPYFWLGAEAEGL